MKFYLSSIKDREPYNDLKNNELMQKYLREIKKEAGVEITFEKATTFEGYQHIVVDMLSMKALTQIMKATCSDLVIDIAEDDKYPTICIYDSCIE